jgi:hypothetical protein
MQKQTDFSVFLHLRSERDITIVPLVRLPEKATKCKGSKAERTKFGRGSPNRNRLARLRGGPPRAPSPLQPRGANFAKSIEPYVLQVRICIHGWHQGII